MSVKRDSVQSVHKEILRFSRENCKSFLVVLQDGESKIAGLPVHRLSYHLNTPPAPKPKFDGNLQYIFDYRSYVDGIRPLTDFQQHQTNFRLNFRLADYLPLTAWCSLRHSNSPFGRTTLNVALQMDRPALRQALTRSLAGSADSLSAMGAQLEGLVRQPSLIDPKKLAAAAASRGLDSLAPSIRRMREEQDSLLALYAQLTTQLQGYRKLMAGRQQLLVEARERLLAQRKRGTDSLKAMVSDRAEGIEAELRQRYARRFRSNLPERADSTVKTIHPDTLFARAAAARDSLMARQQKVLSGLSALGKRWKDTAAAWKQQAAGAPLKKAGALAQRLGGKGPGERLTTLLAGITRLGIGNTWVSYSPLTVDQLPLTGLNVEWEGERWSAALAGGVVKPQQLDVVQRPRLPAGQYLVAARIGYRPSPVSKLTGSWFQGRKPLFNLLNAGDRPKSFVLAGYALEWQRQLGRDHRLTVEYGHTVVNGRVQSSGKNSTGLRGSSALFLAYTGQAPGWKAQWLVSARALGQRFQSFSLAANTNTQTLAWQVQYRQRFWKERLSVTAGAQRNQSSNPEAAYVFTNTSVQQSWLLSLAVPKWPLVQAGYFPALQSLVGPEGYLYQFQSQTGNLNVSHQYRLAGVQSLSTLCWSLTSTAAADSLLPARRLSTTTFSHTFFRQRWQLSAAGTATRFPERHYGQAELTTRWQCAQRLSVGGGGRYLFSPGQPGQLGGSALLSWQWRRVADVQLQYERVFLPGFTNVLKPVETGRITLNRRF